jgi:hypothetical protein
MKELKYEGKYNTWADVYQRIIQSQRLESVQREYFNNYLKKVNSEMNYNQGLETYSYALES